MILETSVDAAKRYFSEEWKNENGSTEYKPGDIVKNARGQRAFVISVTDEGLVAELYLVTRGTAVIKRSDGSIWGEGTPRP